MASRCLGDELHRSPLPIPKTTLPNPNGCDDLLQASKILQTVAVPPVETATHTQLKAFVTQYARVFDLIETGLAKPCQVPVTWNDPQVTWYSASANDLTDFRNLARALCAKAKLAELDGRIDDARCKLKPVYPNMQL